MSPTDKELKTQLLAKAEEQINKLLAKRKPAEEITLSNTEGLAREAGEGWIAEISRSLSEASGDEVEVLGPHCEQRGREMHYKGHKSKQVMTKTGMVRLRRAYYYCDTCPRGIFPLDERWGLNESGYSARLSQDMAWLSSLLPSYRAAQQVLERIGHKQVPLQSLWRRTQAEGQHLQEAEAAQQAQVSPERVEVQQPNGELGGSRLRGGRESSTRRT